MASKSETKVVTGVVRLSYTHLFEPWALNPTDTAKYSTVVLIPKKDKATINALKAAQARATERGTERFGAAWAKKGLKTTLHDGDTEADLDQNPEYAGHMYLSASNSRRPMVVDAMVRPVLDQEEVYSGCYARVSLDAFPYKHPSGGNGLSFSLGNVQKIRDGERFDGSTSADADFEAYTDEDDAGDLL